jgi:hypothetical protein
MATATRMSDEKSDEEAGTDTFALARKRLPPRNNLVDELAENRGEDDRVEPEELPFDFFIRPNIPRSRGNGYFAH